jgi:hypothetical protein
LGAAMVIAEFAAINRLFKQADNGIAFTMAKQRLWLLKN